MSNILGKNTKPELLVRKALFKSGFRYRINRKNLPGKPDIVLPKYKTVIFVNGCFWHGHSGCKKSSLPKTRIQFWQNKIENNIIRDNQNIDKLIRLDWSVIVLWECEINKAQATYWSQLIEKIKSNSRLCAF